MFFPFLIGGAVAVDAFAAGVWLGHRWGTSSTSSSMEAALKEALSRAVTLPAGGIPAVAKEVADGASQVGQSVTQVAQSVSQVAGDVKTAVATVKATTTDVHSALEAALALAGKK